MRYLSVCVAVALVSVSASGATMSYNTGVAVSSTNWAQILLLPQFDASLGTLNSVSLSLDASLSQTLMYENTSTSSGGSIVFEIVALGQKTGADYTLALTGGGMLLAGAIDNTPAYTYSVYDSVMDFGGTSGGTHIMGLSALLNNIFTGGDMSPFIGTGNVSLDASATGRSAYQATGGNIAVGTMTRAGTDVTVVYDYTPVPEPMTIGLLSLGGLLLVRRRK